MKPRPRQEGMEQMAGPASPATPPTTQQPGPAQPAQPAQPRRLGLAASVALLLMALLAVGSIGFAAGRLTGPAPAAAMPTATLECDAYGPAGQCLIGDDQSRTGVWGPGGMRAGLPGTVVSGTVKAIDSDSLSLRLAGGRILDVSLVKSTVYRIAGAAGTASRADVKVGSTVTVSLAGTKTLTARQVVIRKR
jgi:hypothetical protein